MTVSSSPAQPDLAALLPQDLVAELLALGRSCGAEFAEIYGEHTLVTAFTLDEDRLKTSQLSVMQGVGVRAVVGEQTGYAYADGFAPADLREAARVASSIARDGRGSPTRVAATASATFRVVDAPAPFTLAHPFPAVRDEPSRIAMCRRANESARGHDGRIHEVSVSLADSSKTFVVANSEGVWAEDRQFLSRLTVSALALEGDNRQQGFAAGGGSVEAEYFDRERPPEAIATEAAGIAITLLGAREPEAGAYPVVVGPGWGGVLVHECFGHSMEGDTIRKRTSIRAGQ